MPDPTVPSAREVALGHLLRVEADGAFVARVAGRADGGEAPADVARRASDYVAGVTRQRRWLDFLLSHVVSRPLESLDAPLLQILRIGAYDLVVRRTPPHAAVSETVGLARGQVHAGAVGLVNGVLRALARRLDSLPEPASGDPADDLAVRLSHPTPVVRGWLEAFGGEATRALLDHDNRPPVYGLRVSAAARLGADAAAEREAFLRDVVALGAQAEASRWLDDFVTTRTLQPVLRAGWVGAGRCAVQDEAAGLVVRVLDPRPGERVLDAAAAPGGKALYAALRGGSVVALDVNRAKTRLVAQAAREQGADAVEAVSGDLRTWESPGGAGFDAVLLDAPCSGTGVLAKRADLRWNQSPERTADLLRLQDELLDAAARHVRPGGRLVYATCSIERAENDDRVAAFLGRNAGWRVGPAGDRVPAEMRDGPVYRALPHVHHTDGAFAARLVHDP
jgi:16S rRNA (cytosine967-C5)-methyltransferase